MAQSGIVRRYKRRIFRVWKTATGFALLMFFCSSLQSQVLCEKSQTQEEAWKSGSHFGEIYIICKVPSNELHRLSPSVSITGKREGDWIYAYAGESGFRKVVDSGIEYSVLPHPSSLVFPEMKNSVDVRDCYDWDFYPTYEAYLDIMSQFAAEHPSICTVFSIGNSVQGRSIMIAKISDNVNVSEGEPLVLYTSTMHGNELTGYILMLRLIDHILKGYDVDPQITQMVNELEIWINPLANPDGTYRSGNHTVAGSTRFNANNVDLNRNYPDPKDGPHPDGNPWQKETIAFMNLADSVQFTLSANLHTGAEVCNYPWDTWSKLHPDDNWWQFVCRAYADTVHIHAPSGYLNDFNNGITNGYDWYSISGGRQDYMNYFAQCREFTLELSSVFIPEAGTLPSYWEYNHRSLLNYLQEALYGLRGTVTDSATGNPVRAMVTIAGHDADSSQIFSSVNNGKYFRPLYEGVYEIVFSAPGYLTKTISGISVANRQSVILNVVLTHDSSAIPESASGEMFLVYPNPAVDHVFLLYHGSESLVVNVGVVDAAGKTALSFPDVAFERRQAKKVPLPSLAGGLYFMTIESKAIQVRKKLFIKKSF